MGAVTWWGWHARIRLGRTDALIQRGWWMRRSTLWHGSYTPKCGLLESDCTSDRLANARTDVREWNSAFLLQTHQTVDQTFDVGGKGLDFASEEAVQRRVHDVLHAIYGVVEGRSTSRKGEQVGMVPGNAGDSWGSGRHAEIGGEISVLVDVPGGAGKRHLRINPCLLRQLVLKHQLFAAPANQFPPTHPYLSVAAVHRDAESVPVSLCETVTSNSD